MKWMDGWRNEKKGDQCDVIFVQETHIITEASRCELQAYWNRIWGVTEATKTTSFWSTTAEPTAGVGILINPKTIETARKIDVGRHAGRVLATEIDGIKYVNIYAPVNVKDCEVFFHELYQILKDFGDKVLGGDFNCVLNPRQGRYGAGNRRNHKSESAKLQQLTEQLQFHDALQTTRKEQQGFRNDATDHFTFWRQRQASRIDRFYTTTALAHLPQWIEVGLPVQPSDHQALMMVMKHGSKSQVKRSARQLTYPIKSSRPNLSVGRVQTEVQRRTARYQDEKSVHWEAIAAELVKSVADVTKTEARQTRRLVARLTRKRKRLHTSRLEWIGAMSSERRARAEWRFGDMMKAEPSDIKHFCQRVANWQRDQTISTLTPTPGRTHPERWNLANVMAAEWQLIMGQSHSTIRETNRNAKFDKLVTIPGRQKVKPEWNELLLAAIGETEVQAAVDALK